MLHEPGKLREVFADADAGHRRVDRLELAADVGRRVYIAGVVTNTPDNMVRWIVDPPSIDPQTAMPVTGISIAEARDVAAYLYSLRR